MEGEFPLVQLHQASSPPAVATWPRKKIISTVVLYLSSLTALPLQLCVLVLPSLFLHIHLKCFPSGSSCHCSQVAWYAHAVLFSALAKQLLALHYLWWNVVLVPRSATRNGEQGMDKVYMVSGKHDCLRRVHSLHLYSKDSVLYCTWGTWPVMSVIALERKTLRALHHPCSAEPWSFLL